MYLWKRHIQKGCIRDGEDIEMTQNLLCSLDYILFRVCRPMRVC